MIPLGNYSQQSDCTWTLKVPQGQRIELHFSCKEEYDRTIGTTEAIAVISCCFFFQRFHLAAKKIATPTTSSYTIFSRAQMLDRWFLDFAET